MNTVRHPRMTKLSTHPWHGLEQLEPRWYFNGEIKSVVWTDADGTQGTVTFKGGDANLVFEGDNIVQTSVRGKIIVTGENVRLLRFELTNTTNKSLLTVKTKGGDKLVSVDDIQADGPINKINAKGLDVLGDITIPGFLLNLVIHDMAGGNTIQIGASADPKHGLTLKANDITDTDLNSGIGVKSVNVRSWLNTDATDNAITAPWWNKGAVAGDFNLDVNLSGAGALKKTFGSLKAKGDITGGDWDVNGAGGGKSIAANTITDLVADFEGPIGKITTKGDAQQLDITASLIGGIKTGGDIEDSSFRAIGAFDPAVKHIGSVKAKGSITDTIIRAVNGNVNSVKATALVNSQIYAGIADLEDGEVLPSVVDGADFLALATIKSVSLKNKLGPAFENSAIAAWTLGKLSLGTIETDNGGNSLGVAGNTIAGLTGNNADGAKLTLKKLATAADRDAQLVENPFPLEDFEIRLV